MNNLARHSLLRASFVGLSFLAAGNANALIAAGEVDKGGATPELVLVVFDPVKQVSFTKDLGIYAAPFDPVNDNSKNFFVQAQQDAGYQKFFDPLNSDANFKEFLKASTNAADQVWAVYAAGAPDFFGPGSKNLFTTLTNGAGGGVINPNYTSLIGIQNTVFADMTAGAFAGIFFGNLNRGQNSNGEAGNSFNSHYLEGEVSDPGEYLLLNGSSFDVKGEQAPYFGALAGATGYGSIIGVLPSSVNPVGSSSWFYYLTPSDNNSTNKVLVDEFDNLGHDGYWGLAVDSKGDYILSFTMEAHLTSATTAQGLARRNRTDFSALYGGVRSLTAPSDEFIGWQPNGSFGAVTAVPEPSTYGLFAMGLLALGLRARRQAKA
ncbi:PEP-CTERM sorting domain-containing protein [Roseateles oligotrophus]|uniref:PEP-CTERM sorting domain-containing protein n=1 Tax=Roseateles oligotrophus TaxID=1769250 RepID=A0ABT2YAG9_9BURK|nr:PEP-CTERM sorting domain-containing protein [Roseateles oligotrophus]MCV2367303.1 PEP-CTERM sorting domain-containing protein [Roseateles oligotrophus]